jgi:hypothetical protein
MTEVLIALLAFLAGGFVATIFFAMVVAAATERDD